MQRLEVLTREYGPQLTVMAEFSTEFDIEIRELKERAMTLYTRMTKENSQALAKRGDDDGRERHLKLRSVLSCDALEYLRTFAAIGNELLGIFADASVVSS